MWILFILFLMSCNSSICRCIRFIGSEKSQPLSLKIFPLPYFSMFSFKRVLIRYVRPSNIPFFSLCLFCLCTCLCSFWVFCFLSSNSPVLFFGLPNLSTCFVEFLISTFLSFHFLKALTCLVILVTTYILFTFMPSFIYFNVSYILY